MYSYYMLSLSTDWHLLDVMHNILNMQRYVTSVAGQQYCQMQVEKNSPMSSWNKLKKLQTSPKYVMTLTVCSESNHHYLTVVAVLMQHTNDLSYKATSNIQNSK